MFKVAIVGRPNVGKSTLFNRLTQSRKAIVGDEPGITRDRQYNIAHWGGKQFEVIDTGGILPGSGEELPEQIFQQAEIALEEADLILLVTDGRQGPTPVDESLNSLLRASGKPFLLVVNKIDVPSVEIHVPQFHSLGVDRLFPVSAEHSNGVDELVDHILQEVPEEPEEVSEPEIRVAIIGRPNVGKSSLLNCFAGRQRVIVSQLPGTTRDAVDTVISAQGKRFRLVDTAGLKKRGKTEGLVEKISAVMAQKSIERADVVLLVIDATEGVAKIEATIGSNAHDAGKSIIIVANKWDLVEKDAYTAIKLEKEFRRRLRFLDFAPLLSVSAKTGQRAFKLLEYVVKAYQARYHRVSTSDLNRFVEKEIQPRLQASGTLRKFPLLYASQVGVAPPTIVLFTRQRKPLSRSIERFMINQLRSRYDFYATPIRIRQRLRR